MVSIITMQVHTKCLSPQIEESVQTSTSSILIITMNPSVISFYGNFLLGRYPSQ